MIPDFRLRHAGHDGFQVDRAGVKPVDKPLDRGRDIGSEGFVAVRLDGMLEIPRADDPGDDAGAVGQRQHLDDLGAQPTGPLLDRHPQQLDLGVGQIGDGQQQEPLALDPRQAGRQPWPRQWM